MTESQLITLGYRYERANGARAQALRFWFDVELNQLTSEELRAEYIHCFNQGRQTGLTESHNLLARVPSCV